ncbi:helix-turn-helix transcriptional regulator [Flavobacterium sp.]|uniref:helix-turn-helix domain-containing protein n=1 Tax=Flavobacterium sp. TaxID=239 RepID=UPI0025F2B3F3|nr:helix-turn-helix transcriptional regulator [Flavobacterium sp.]
MVNIDDFVKRLEILLEYYNLNASSFADKIGVQRSSLSHLLSGRNKPSLDFILKILEVFPEVDLYWILNGKGSFPKTIGNNNVIKTPPAILNSEPISGNLFSTIPEAKTTTPTVEVKKIDQLPQSISNEVEKIVFFYKDGTFKEFKSN